MAVVLYAPALALEAGRIIMAIGRCVWGGRLVLGFLGGFIHFADNSYMAVVLYAPALALEAGRIIMAIGRCVWGGVGWC